MPNGKMNCFADTMLLVYALDPEQAGKRQWIKNLLRQIVNRHTLVLSPQTLNEFYRVVTERRGLVPKDEARLLVWSWSEFCTAPYNFDVTRRAWKIQDDCRFSWWDCMLLASASMADCDVFLSEDMQHERVIDGLTILNPFRLDPNLQSIK